MLIRLETPLDAPAIRALVGSAFQDAAHASGTEAEIVDILRAARALTLSLVAITEQEVVGHVAFSSVTVGRKGGRWFGLGPLAVRRDQRRQGIGERLVHTGLDTLKEWQAGGCVVLGDPAYYARFGFVSDPRLTLPGVPSEYFQVLPLAEDVPTGEVSYHRAFDAG